MAAKVAIKDAPSNAARDNVPARPPRHPARPPQGTKPTMIDLNFLHPPRQPTFLGGWRKFRSIIVGFVPYRTIADTTRRLGMGGTKKSWHPLPDATTVCRRVCEDLCFDVYSAMTYLSALTIEPSAPSMSMTTNSSPTPSAMLLHWVRSIEKSCV